MRALEPESLGAGPNDRVLRSKLGTTKMPPPLVNM